MAARMSGGQMLYVTALVVIAVTVFVGSLILPMSVFTALMFVIFGFAEWFRKEITPEGEELQSPLTILRDSELWQGIGVAYLCVIVLVVLYHLGVERLSVFEKINMPVFLALILGAAAGPIAVHVTRTYRLLGGTDKE